MLGSIGGDELEENGQVYLLVCLEVRIREVNESKSS